MIDVLTSIERAASKVRTLLDRGADIDAAAGKSDSVSWGPNAIEIDRIVSVLQVQGVNVAARRPEIERFVAELDHMHDARRRWLADLQTPEIFRPSDILYWILWSKRAGDIEEALWRTFLATHFGRMSCDDRVRVRDSAARFLCGFGAEPTWTWNKVSTDLQGLREWLQIHSAELAELQFGNHRKYESKKPERLFAVIASFVEWVNQNGGSPRRAFETAGARTREETFDDVYRGLEVDRLGRLARYDHALLLADLGLIDGQPGSVYLEGAAGPLKGARRLWGRLSDAKLARLADELAAAAGLPYEIVEDALCMWQK